MPIYGFKCVNCGMAVDKLMSWEKMQRTEVVCTKCNVEMRRVITAPAKTASGWGDQGNISGIYNKGLGCFVKNDRHADEIAKSRGLVRFQDAFDGKSFERVIGENIDSQCNIHLQHDADVVLLKDKMSEGFNMGEAFAEVFSVDRMKADGVLTEDVKG